ncbi:MAG: aminotransferase class I/II-fold pyridoxal phosphate-dependent enzyme [candidate division Zixibacteria bacterium]|jgi:aspartate/methionine/tyrosine aminotransferase|nr:aminotransferase class I/II-fold pyridoxal phosphate-dependent enzyme [candidate division Zixibacteria bacterium]
MSITTKHLNERLLQAEYAVRGPIVQRAQELEAAGQKIIYCNIGNPQALQQKPLTYFRQILSLVEYPDLLENADVTRHFPRDVVERAKSILARHPHGTGAYSQSAGIPFIRNAVASFIAQRDGIPADPAAVIMTDGASKGAQAVLMALIKKSNDGFMIPIPQYPLYSASLELYGGRQIGYLLDDDEHWQLNETTLEKSLESAKANKINPVGIVVINPGNPTGAVLTVENIQMIIAFARRHHLSIIADEVYQENVYAAGQQFHSFAKVMGHLGVTDVPLFSLHSISKGFLGECGHRGGYLEIRNVPDDVLAQFIKLQSISLCANVPGQIAAYLMVSPPQPGERSYETYVEERDAILTELKAKALILGEGINSIPGMSVDVPQGAMYAFVRFELPDERGVDIGRMSPRELAAYTEKRETDYCLALLEKTGICVVPGSGFGQKPGTYHFRMTFLPPREEIQLLIERLSDFHCTYTGARVDSAGVTAMSRC